MSTGTAWKTGSLHCQEAMIEVWELVMINAKEQNPVKAEIAIYGPWIGVYGKDRMVQWSDNLLQHCLYQYTGIRIPRAHYEDLIHLPSLDSLQSSGVLYFEFFWGLAEAHHRQHIAGEANHWLHSPRKFDKAIQNLGAERFWECCSGHSLDITSAFLLSNKPNLGMGCINGKGFEDIRNGFHSHTCKCGSCPVSLGLGHILGPLEKDIANDTNHGEYPSSAIPCCHPCHPMQSCCGEISPSSNAAPPTTGRAVAIQSGARACPSVELRSKWRSFAGQIGGM